jgi:cytoskeletal protein RodZ
MAIRLSSSSISSGGGGDANAGDGSDKRGRRKKKKKIPSYNYLMTLLVLVASAIILLYASSSSVRNNNYTTSKDMIVFGSKAVMSSTISSSSDEPNNNDDPSASLSPPYIDKHYCFIHIGKAAGSKVSCELGYRYTDCGKNYTPTYITTPTNTNRTANSVPNILNNKSLHGGRVHISHMNYKRKCLHDDIFLVTVRHPLTGFRL